MGVFARGKRALSISDRSGMRFPYTEMVREWNGSLVHYSEYEPKQPQLQPKPVGSDPQALQNPRVQAEATAQLILLENNPFEVIIYSGDTYVNVYSLDHQRAAGSKVRLRGPAQVVSSGPGGDDQADALNLQSFAPINTIVGVTDIDSANGFTIALGKIDANGTVTGATTSDVLTNPINYFYFQSSGTASTSGVKGGGANCSAGPVTLKAI
jgi:hypothetical protein|tara:strand:- start:569 stop:1201 length:633 start_codon:yes stop_codon:yes gene_type:complete